MKSLRCYKCDGVLKNSDDFVFVATLAVHRTGCPVKLTEKQTEYLLRMRGSLAVPKEPKVE